MEVQLIILGPPGSGKGTYSMRLINDLKIVKISTGDIFRDMATRSDELGKQVAGMMKRGELIPDEIVLKIFDERMSQPDTKNGFILDGCPRTVPQTKELEKIVKIDAIIHIIAKNEILIEKISARRICSNASCDGNYNIADISRNIDGTEYILPPLMPKKEGMCDKCGNTLYQRSDDKPDVIASRLEVYEKQTKPLVDHYRDKIPFIDIHMNRPPEQIVEKILSEIKKLGI